MGKLMERIFKICGKTARLTGRAGERTVTVALKGSRSTVFSRSFLPLGEVPQGNRVCYFPADSAVAAGDTLVLEEGKFRVCRTESCGFADRQPLYIWALCAPMGEEDTWGL